MNEDSFYWIVEWFRTRSTYTENVFSAEKNAFRDSVARQRMRSFIIRTFFFIYERVLFRSFLMIIIHWVKNCVTFCFVCILLFFRYFGD
jgi:hypothetical protein